MNPAESPPTPSAAEAHRLAVVHGLKILDTEPEAAFDALGRVANVLCETPIAALSIIDRERLFFKSCIGLDLKWMPRQGSMCDHNILQASLLQVQDASKDLRFQQHPLVAKPPGLRFYAGQPISVEGHRVATLCVADIVPRSLNLAQQRCLIDLAVVAQALLQQRLVRNTLEPKRAKADLPVGGRRKKVVYVEDNRLNAMLLEQLFANITDTDLIVCPSLDDLYRVLQVNVPDLLLLDINLPGASGLDILAWLKGKRATSGLRVIMVSADATQEAIKASRELGADDFWTKPLDLANVLKCLESLGQGPDRLS